jgi:CARDB protein
MWGLHKPYEVPATPTSGDNKVALKPIGKGNENAKPRRSNDNLVALKPIGKGNEDAKPRRSYDNKIAQKPIGKGNAIDFGFESKPGPIGNGTPSTPAPNPNPGGPVGNGTPSTPAPNPNPGGPVGNGTPSIPNPNPYPGNQYPGRFPRFPLPYPSGPVVISQPSPVIVNQPAPVIEATEAPVVETITEADVPATVTTLEASSADLVLEDIHLAEGATLIAGPSYRLKFRNQGTAAARKFQVALLAALDAQLTNKAPRALVEVPGLAAGESMEAILRLPKSAMRLASTTTGQLGEFTHLYLAVDFQNTVAELDETNNVADLERLAVDAADQAAMQQ